MPQKKAIREGYTQNLWLHGPEHFLTEVGTMNMFVVFKRGESEIFRSLDRVLNLLTFPTSHHFGHPSSRRRTDPPGCDPRFRLDPCQGSRIWKTPRTWSPIQLGRRGATRDDGRDQVCIAEG